MDSSAEKQKDPCLMKTQFLKPFVTSIDDPVAGLPRGNFKRRAKRMEALHAPTWRKAGILEAIKASTYKIHENQSLNLALVERWCPETKSFVFPWGEATITLEDVMVVLGFSVLGSPVFAPLESSEMRDSVEKMEKVRVETMNTASLASQEKWILSFINRDDEMEHEAFLALWLSQFVFPDKARRSISRNVLSIAVRLARGERIALAPAVLASIYRDLGQIQAFARDKSKKTLNLKSLFKLVQLWAWERFRNIRPEATNLLKGEARIARWSDLRQRDEEENVSLNLDDFDWRPYTKPLQNWNPPRFYVEEAMWITVDESLDDEFVSFARCLRVSQLVGIGFVEDYYPNRVAMQFGLSQDLPGLVTHDSNITEKEAWDDYNKPLDGLKLYIPSRIATTLVTARYRDWWLKSVSEFLGSEESTDTFFASKTVNADDCGGSVSTELPLGRMFQKELVKRKSEHLRNKKRKRASEDDESCMDYKDDNITIAEWIKSRGKYDGDNDNITIAEIVNSRKKTVEDASEEDNNDSSGLCQKLASEDETVAPQEIEQRSEENDEEETGSKAEEITVLISSHENNSSDPPLSSNGGVIDIAVSPPKTKEACDDEKKTVIDVETKEPERLLKEVAEKQRCNDKDDDNIDERLRKKEIAIEEMALKIEARLIKEEKSLREIRDWITRRNQTKTGVSA